MKANQSSRDLNEIVALREIMSTGAADNAAFVFTSTRLVCADEVFHI